MPFLSVGRGVVGDGISDHGAPAQTPVENASPAAYVPLSFVNSGADVVGDDTTDKLVLICGDPAAAFTGAIAGDQRPVDHRRTRRCGQISPATARDGTV